MCLLITVATAIVFSVLFFASKRNKVSAENADCSGIRKFTKPLFTTALAFWAAAIMWSVDGIANVLGGEPFLEISKEDSVLGVIVALCGVALFAVLALRNLKNHKE